MQTTEQPAHKPSILLRAARQPSGGQREGAAGAALRRKGEAAAILQRQREIGNAAVQRLILQRKGEADGVAGRAVAAEVEDEIQRARGGGNALDGPARAQMEGALGTDLSAVRVHTDGRADRLNQALEARAFTTGQDVFFRQGQYNPGSAGGRELLAHELTHVVQQGGGAQADAVQAKLTVGAADDEYEQEADQVARQVMRKEQGSIQRQPEAEEPQPEESPAEEPAEEEDVQHD